MENRYINEDYALLGAEMIRTEPSLQHILDSQATIVFLSSDCEKRSNGRLVYAQCERVPWKWKWAVPCDFTVTVFDANVARFTDEQMRILLLHELLHVGIDRDGNEERYFLVPHDVEDFREVIDRFGLEWNGQAGKAKRARRGSARPDGARE